MQIPDFVGRELNNYSLTLPYAYQTPGKKYLFNLDIHSVSHGLVTPAKHKNLERTIGETTTHIQKCIAIIGVLSC